MLGSLVAIALLYLFFRGLAWRDLAIAFREAQPLLLLGVIASTIVVYVIRAWRWGYLLAPLARPRFKDLFAITMIGFGSGLVLPRAGEILRPYLIGRQYRVPAVAAFASIILERLFDLVTVLLLFALYLYVLPLPAEQTQGPLLALLKKIGALGAAGTFVVLALLWLLHVHAERVLPLIEWSVGWLPIRISQMLVRAVHSFTDGLAVLRAPASHLLMLFGQSLLLWLGIALTFYFNHLAFGLHLPFHANFFLIGFLTVGVAIPTPGMVGGFHEFYLLALTQGFGVARGTAAAAGIAAHALSNLPVLVLGLVFLGRYGLSFGRMAALEHEQDAPPQSQTSDARTEKKEDHP